MDAKQLSKLTIKISEKLFTSVVELRKMPIIELIGTAEEIIEMQKEEGS